jgi:lipopolysaccharide biosynthesis regulator YciM
LPSVAAIAVLMVFWFYRRSWTRAWFFAYAYFLVALVPVMGLALNTYFNLSFVADHFQYLAAMGPMALAGAGMVRLADRIAPGEWWPGLSIGAGVLLVLGVVSGERAGVYQSEEILWTDTLQKNPACWLGHNNLGNLLHHEGRIEEAVAHLEEALKLMPDFADAHANVANIYFQLGRLDEAQAHYQAALRSDPDFPNAHYNFGLLLSQQGRQAEAIEHFQRALELNPNFPEAHNGLGIAYVRANRIADAIVQFQAALQERPGYDDAQKNLARMESLGTPAAK